MPVFSAVLDPQLYEADIKHCTPDLLSEPCADSGSTGRQDRVTQTMVCRGVWRSLDSRALVALPHSRVGLECSIGLCSIGVLPGHV